MSNYAKKNFLKMSLISYNQMGVNIPILDIFLHILHFFLQNQ